MRRLCFKKGVFSKSISFVICLAMILAMCYTPVTISEAAVEDIDICTDTSSQTATLDSSETTYEVRYSAPASYTTLAALADAGYDTFTVSYTVTSYTAASGETAGVMAFISSGNIDWDNNESWNNLSDASSGTISIDLSSISTTDTSTVIFGIQFANITGDITFTINSAILSGDGTGGSSGGSNSGLADTTSTVVSGIDYNYAQLLEEALYFYDANMCGTDVGENSDLNWRDDCHTGDQYVVYDEETIDLSGGYHDAGDHVKFGLPQAYSASVLGMSYYEFGDAFDDLGLTDHYKTIMDHFIEYFEKCTVLTDDINASDVSVKTFCYQVGDGNTDHNYWGSPEDQDSSQGTRETQALFTSETTPGTDIVCETAAALAIYSINFSDSTALKYAELLFEYANSFSTKSVTNISGFYESSSWEDDYALAAAWLYKATGDSSYVTYYNSTSIRSQGWLGWVLSWDDVTSAAFLYGPTTSNLKYVSSYITSTSGTTADNGFCFISSWGSARYNCALQFMGLAYDSITDTDSFSEWAEGQMNYILGNNAGGHCFIVGYNDYSVKYPHHRAASGYTNVSGNGTTTQAHVLLGALVGGPTSTSSAYVDTAEDYTSNEVALDYQAGLVVAAAGLYEYTMKNGTDDEKNAQQTVEISEIISTFSQSGSSDGLRGLYSNSSCTHTYDDPTWKWSDDYTSATATFTCESCDDTQTVDATVTSEVTTKATCKEAGETTYTATVTFDGTNYTDTQTEAIAKTDHTYDAGEITTAATCTTDGVTTYTCTVCGDTKTEAIAATGHTLVCTQEVAATCTEDGNGEYYTCSSCGLYFSDANGTTEITKDSWVIAATGHTWDEGEITTPATQTTDGVITYTCTVCGETYTKAITASGHTHTYEATEWTWTKSANDDYQAMVTLDCSDDECDSSVTLDAAVTSITTAATCTEAGETVYTATVTYEGETYTDTKTVTIEATGHNYEGPDWTWGSDYSTATAAFTCKNCSDVKTYTATVTSETTKEATESEDGILTYTASVTVDGTTYTDTKTQSVKYEATSGSSGGTSSGGSTGTDTGSSGTGNTDSGSSGNTGSTEAGSTEASSTEAGSTETGSTEAESTGNTESGNNGNSSSKTVVSGATYMVDNYLYLVTNAATDGTGTVTLTGMVKGASTVKVPATIKINGISFKVTAIGNGAFKNNKVLTVLNIGKNVTVVGKQAFMGCTSLKTVKGGKNVKNIKAKAFAKCSSLKKVTIKSKKLKKIGKKAFVKCKNLKKVTLKTKKLKSIGKKAFKNTKATIKINVVNSKKKTYKKLFYKAGVNKNRAKVY